MHNTDQPLRIDTLTSLRFFGIMLIVFHHLGAPIPWQPPGLGDLGTTFFFVLSGFVLPLGQVRFASFGDSLRFLWNRIVRIYPVHLLTFLASLPYLLTHGASILLGTALINILLMQSWFHTMPVFFSFNVLSWFLSTLLFCYAVFTVIMFKPTRLLPFAFLLSSVSLLASVMYVERTASGYGQESTVYFLHIFPPNKLLIFLLGVAASFAFKRVYHSVKNRIGFFFATFLEFLVTAAILQYIFFRSLSKYLIKWLVILLPQLKYTLFYLVENYIVFSFLTILALWVFGLERGFVSRILRHKYVLFLGKISLCIYMSHQLIFSYIGMWKESLVSSFGEIVVDVTACMVVIPISFMMHTFVEAPISNRWKIDRPIQDKKTAVENRPIPET